MGNKLPLTCDLGFHRADPLARWNDGYYFSKCTRCGRDLVRTAYQRWHVPKGYRVVWQAQPPGPRKPARAHQSSEAAPARSPASELPIQEVLRDLSARDLSNDEGVGCEDVKPHSPSPTAPEDFHVGRVRVTEVRVDQLLVSDVQVRPATEASGEEEGPGPELPFEEAVPEAEEDTTAEPEPPVEEPAAEDADAPSPAPPAPAPAPAPAPRVAADDFMADYSDADFWNTAPRPPKPPAETSARTGSDQISQTLPADEEHRGEDPPGSSDESTEPQGKNDRVAWPDFRRLLPRREQKPEAEKQVRDQPSGNGLSLSGRLAVASLAVAAVLMFASLITRPSIDKAPSASNPAATAPAPAQAAPAEPKAQPPALTASALGPSNEVLFPARQKAFVAARILNCRASPVEQARSVKKLSRGAEVEILAREAEWMSISHGGRQCWAAVRYIAPDRPA